MMLVGAIFVLVEPIWFVVVLVVAVVLLAVVVVVTFSFGCLQGARQRWRTGQGSWQHERF